MKPEVRLPSEAFHGFHGWWIDVNHLYLARRCDAVSSWNSFVSNKQADSGKQTFLPQVWTARYQSWTSDSNLLLQLRRLRSWTHNWQVARPGLELCPVWTLSTLSTLHPGTDTLKDVGLGGVGPGGVANDESIAVVWDVTPKVSCVGNLIPKSMCHWYLGGNKN
jgi:hypothetical protein